MTTAAAISRKVTGSRAKASSAMASISASDGDLTPFQRIDGSQDRGRPDAGAHRVMSEFPRRPSSRGLDHRHDLANADEADEQQAFEAPGLVMRHGLDPQIAVELAAVARLARGMQAHRHQPELGDAVGEPRHEARLGRSGNEEIGPDERVARQAARIGGHGVRHRG